MAENIQNNIYFKNKFAIDNKDCNVDIFLLNNLVYYFMLEKYNVSIS